MTVFFSVDVETTSTNPFSGELLTVGIVPVCPERKEIIDTGIHIPLQFTGDNTDSATVTWWNEKTTDAAREAAWGGDKRHTTQEAALILAAYVKSFNLKWNETIFAANPVSFDYPWIVKLFTEAGVENPFHYRTLCMRSMRYGQNGIWGFNREETGEWNEPEIPHHAYHDAHAQALDLIRLINKVVISE